MKMDIDFIFNLVGEDWVDGSIVNLHFNKTLLKALKYNFSTLNEKKRSKSVNNLL